jgi:hypothetical protein
MHTQDTKYCMVDSALETTPFLQKTVCTMGAICNVCASGDDWSTVLAKHEPTYLAWKLAGPAIDARISIDRYSKTTSPTLFVVQNDVTLWAMLSLKEDQHADAAMERWGKTSFLVDVDTVVGVAMRTRWASEGMCRIVYEMLRLDPAFAEIVAYMYDHEEFVNSTFTAADLIDVGLRPYDTKLQTVHIIWYHARMEFLQVKTAVAGAAERALLLELGREGKTKVKRNKRAPKAEEAAALPLGPLPTAAAAAKALKLLEAEYAAASKAARTAVAAVSIGSAAAKEARVARKVAAEQAQRVAKGKLDRAKHQLKQALAAPPAAASGRREPMDVQELVARLDALAGRAHRLEPDAGGAAGGASGGDHFEADAALARTMQAELDAAVEGLDSDEFDTSCSVCLDAEPTVSSACCANIKVCAECAAKLRTCLQCRCEGVVFVAF